MSNSSRIINYMVETILRDPSCDSIAMKMNRKISREEYETFKVDYVFEALKEIPYGKAFCDRFGIIDYGLYYSRDRDNSIKIIEKNYLE